MSNVIVTANRADQDFVWVWLSPEGFDYNVDESPRCPAEFASAAGWERIPQSELDNWLRRKDEILDAREAARIREYCGH